MDRKKKWIDPAFRDDVPPVFGIIKPRPDPEFQYVYKVDFDD